MTSFLHISSKSMNLSDHFISTKLSIMIQDYISDKLSSMPLELKNVILQDKVLCPFMKPNEDFRCWIWLILGYIGTYI